MQAILRATAAGLSTCTGAQRPIADDPANGTRDVGTQATTGININHVVCPTQQQSDDERKAAPNLSAPPAIGNR
jgi:hypothetical protein